MMDEKKRNRVQFKAKKIEGVYSTSSADLKKKKTMY